MAEESLHFGIAGYLTAAVAFLALGIYVFLKRQAHLRFTLMGVACFVTSAWGLITVHNLWLISGLTFYAETLEVLQTLLWMAFLWSLLRPDRWVSSVWILGIFGLVAVGADFLIVASHGLDIVSRRWSYIARIVLVVGGLLLTENLYRNTPRQDRWAIKFLCLGMGGIFVYDLYLYANIALLAALDANLIQARGAIYALVAPLVAVSAHRIRRHRGELVIARQFALYTGAIISSGVFIIAMATAGYVIREFGASWGAVAHLVFLFGAGVVLVVVLTSGTYRAYLNVLIGKHFFKYKYDYRSEWHRFITTVTKSDSTASLEERIVNGIADIVHCPAGALWCEERGACTLAATWNMAAPSLTEAEVEPLIRTFENSGRIIYVEPPSDAPAASEGADVVPAGLGRLRNAWIIVPLLHHERAIGFVLLGKPRAPQQLGWEDYDLLRTVGRQAGSYLAESHATRELAEALQFERFNRRSAFVLHDIKNLVSQLSVLSSNLERHGGKPEFRSDMTATLNNVVTRMRSLLDRLHGDQASAQAASTVSLAGILSDLSQLDGGAQIEFRHDEDDSPVDIKADHERLYSLFGHVIENAVEAAGDDGWVRISLHTRGDWAVVEVSDNGPGMDEAFIRDELFKPFRSTKSGGFGIGAYQCRDYARELGGDVQVISSVGAGTTVRVSLPTYQAEIVGRTAAGGRNLR